MLATLIFNPAARGSGVTTPEELLDALANVGLEAKHRPTKTEADLDRLRRDISGPIIVVGGDGAFRAVATRVLDKDVTLTVIPTGTANNIARTLGIIGKPTEIIAGLSDRRELALDVGRVRTPWGQDFFLEGAGFGLFAETLAEYDPSEGKSILRAIKALTETLMTRRPRHFQLLLDGRNISGEYMMVEALNTTAIGFRLKLAPDARPSDGLLDVVRIREEQRPALLKYATAMLREELEELPAVEVDRGRRLTIAWDGFPMHVDGIVRNAPTEVSEAAVAPPTTDVEPAESLVAVEILPAALKLWLPAATVEESDE
jgi:diacylglycerol kinase family enzyme